MDQVKADLREIDLMVITQVDPMDQVKQDNRDRDALTKETEVQDLQINRMPVRVHIRIEEPPIREDIVLMDNRERPDLIITIQEQEAKVKAKAKAKVKDLIIIKEIIRDRRAAREAAKEADIIHEALKADLIRMRMISPHTAIDLTPEREVPGPKEEAKEKILTKRFSTRRWLRRTITEETETE